MTWQINMFTDAAAAIGIARRNGMGQIRHLDVTDLWIQEKFNSTFAFLHKVLGIQKPADSFTKYTDRSILNMAMAEMNMHFMNGRSEVAAAAVGTSANDALKTLLQPWAFQPMPLLSLSAIPTECNHYQVQLTEL